MAIIHSLEGQYNTTGLSFGTVALGAAAATRHIIIPVSLVRNTNGAIQGFASVTLTVGGVPYSAVRDSPGAAFLTTDTRHCEIWRVDLSDTVTGTPGTGVAGTTGTLAVTTTAGTTGNRNTAATIRMVGADLSTGPYDISNAKAATAPGSPGGIDVPAGGLIVAAARGIIGGTNSTWTAPFTEIFDQSPVVGYAGSGATYDSVSGDINISPSFNMGAVSWQANAVAYRPIVSTFEKTFTFDYAIENVVAVVATFTFDYKIIVDIASIVTQLPILVLDLAEQPTLISQVPILVVNLPVQDTRITQGPILPVWSPNPIPLPKPIVPDVPVIENWSWLTVLTVAKNSREQRSALRAVPRFSMRINALILNAAERRDVYQMLMKYINRVFFYPLYQHSAGLNAAAIIGATKLFFAPARTDMRDGETIALFDPFLTETHLIAIDTIDADGATLAAPLTFAVPATWLVCPALTFRLPATVGLSMDSVAGSLSLQMDGVRPRSAFQRPTAAPALTSLDGMVIVTPRPLADAGEAFVQDIEWLDNETSIPTPETGWLIPFVAGERSFILKRPVDMDYWRAIGDTLRGRQNPFLLPTYHDDLPLAAVPALGATNLLTSNIQYFDFWRQKTYQYLRIETANGIIYRRVLEALANYNADGEPITVTLKLNAAIGGVAGDNIISVVSFMNICRLASDDITLTHYQLETILSLDIRAVNE